MDSNELGNKSWLLTQPMKSDDDDDDDDDDEQTSQYGVARTVLVW